MLIKPLLLQEYQTQEVHINSQVEEKESSPSLLLAQLPTVGHSKSEGEPYRATTYAFIVYVEHSEPVPTTIKLILKTAE
jgi:hypothetical protein